jgi:hypothetical protein
MVGNFKLCKKYNLYLLNNYRLKQLHFDIEIVIEILSSSIKQLTS